MIAFWDGHRLHGWNEQGEELTNLPAITVHEGEQTEQPPEDVPPPDAAVDAFQPDILIWPIESLLVRPFVLPLSHPRLLDAEILEQELVEQAGVEPGDWWPAWRANAVEGGVAGLAFAMPAHVQSELAVHPSWRSCRFVGVDAWIRLTALVPEDEMDDCAVFDADQEGLFVGVRHGGAWRGIRRLNLAADRACKDLADDAMRSVRAMGYSNAMQAYGRLDATWHAALESGMPDWHGEIVETLPDRASATHIAATDARNTRISNVPNFRHGAWAAPGDWQKRLRPWRRTAVLAGVLLLLVLGGSLYRVHQLRGEQTRIQAGIEAAFHRGLPNEKVMLDPMAQLRKAGGGNGSSDAWLFLRQLQAMGKLQQQIKELHIADMQYTRKGMRLSGTVPDLAAVNRVRDALSSITGTAVEVTDTELADKQVRFRLKWS